MKYSSLLAAVIISLTCMSYEKEEPFKKCIDGGKLYPSDAHMSTRRSADVMV
jgi:hypothetical protein